MTEGTIICEGAQMRVRVAAGTDLGLRRAQNEDSYGCWLPRTPEECHQRGMLLVIADGMGGARGGEVASRLTIDAVTHAYGEAPGKDLAQDLHQAVAAANHAVHSESLARPDLAGMGTTCTALAAREREIVLAHVGDSRAYLARGGEIRQLTHDHSLVGQLVRDRHLTPEQARTDPRRNVVTRSIGVGAEVEIDVERAEEKVEPGDTLILCTDGLHGLVGDEELRDAASGPDVNAGVRDLITLARERGGHDNITVILAHFERAEDGAPAREAEGAAAVRAADRPGRRGRVVAGLATALVLLLVLAWRFASRRALG